MESFLVHIWVPADPIAPDTGLRGVVRHIASGVETAFRGDDEVVRVLRGALDREEPDDADGLGRTSP